VRSGEPLSLTISEGEARVLVAALSVRCEQRASGLGSAELVVALSVWLQAPDAASRLAAARIVRIAADVEVRRAEIAAREPYRSPWKRRRAADRAARRAALAAGSARTHGSAGSYRPDPS
jgi:hypothetical protein